MKATINGFRYDTRKASLVGEASHGFPLGDFSHWSAGLYCTPRAKKFFLAGSGGPMSRWGQSNGIIPIDTEEALAWAEQYLAPAEIEAAFGETAAARIRS